MVDGMRGYPFSVSNVINMDLKGSTAPRAVSNTFRCVGHVLSTTMADMAIGVRDRSYTML